MKLSSALQHSKAGAQRNSAVFWLLCLVVCYQAGYQVYMSVVLGRDPIALDPWCSGSHGSAQQCVEAQLFQGWQNDVLITPETLTPLLERISETEESGTSKQPSIAAGTPIEAVLPRPQDSKVAAPTSAPVAADVKESFLPHHESAGTTPGAKGLIAIQEKYEERVRSNHAAHAARVHEQELHRQERRTQAAHAAIKEWHNMSTLSRDLQDLHDRFGTRLVERQAHTESAKEEMRGLQSVPGAPEADNMTDWSRSLSALQQRMESHMETHNKAHHALDVMDAQIEAHKKAHRVAHSETHGHALLEEIAALGRKLCSETQHHDDPKCKQFRAPATPHATAVPTKTHNLRVSKLGSLDEAEAKLKLGLHQLSEKHQAWEKSFVAKVADTMQDFCSDPLHSTQSTCVQFLHDHPSHSATSDLATKRGAWHQKFRSKIANVGHDLCSNPLRKEYSICKKILGSEAQPAKSSVSLTSVDAGNDEEDMVQEGGISGKTNRLELHWSTVAQWTPKRPSKGLRGSAALAENTSVVAIDAAGVSRLRTSAHWSGRVPSVACIALIPKGTVAKAWMHYFIDNFRLQRYEGPHHLVLVYHHSDQQAAELVHKYADGTYIKSAVARGDEFPSAAAFRFGAWLARDDDVIARWDFGAWHHPQRLSMQVRSLALSGRPASLLERWTVLDKAGANATVTDGQHWDSSLVGEAAWMRANWYPHMPEERALLNSHAARDLVKMDAAHLQVFDEAIL